MSVTLVVSVLVLSLLAAACAVPPSSPGPEERARLPEVRGRGRAPSDDVSGPADPRPFLSVRAQSGATVSPAGAGVAYLDSATGTAQVWLVGRPMAFPSQVTHFADRATKVLWSPNEDRILVAGDVGGDERDDLLLVRPDGSRPVVLARGAEGRQQVGGFTPDGTGLVYASTRRHPAFHDLWIADTATGISRPLFTSDHMNMAGDVSPDGTRAITVRVHGSFEQELAVVDLATGERTRLLPDAPPAVYEDACWSPDGKSILCRSDLGRDFLAVIRVPLDGGKPETVVEADGDVDALAVSASGWLAWAVNDRGLSRLEVLAPAPGAKPRILLEGGRLGAPPVFAAKAPVLVVGWGSATRPASILRFDLGQADPMGQEVTRPDLGGLDPLALVPPVEKVFRSFDGVEISGFLYRPSTASSSCVVLVHGGPEGQYRPSFDPTAQLLVARGHAVFCPNVRGSTGYGRKFSKLDDARLRMNSVADLGAVHDFLVAEGIAAKDRIAVMGGSYGGFMVLAALTHQPERWAAGVDIVGIAHLGTFLKNTGAYRQKHRAAEYGDPVADADFFEATAPLNKADRIRAPLMVIQGRNDPRVPMSEAEQIVAAARKNGVEVEYLLYDDEGHGLAKLKNRLDGYAKAADFLDRVLKK